jgi:hypothetical protein
MRRPSRGVAFHSQTAQTLAPYRARPFLASYDLVALREHWKNRPEHLARPKPTVQQDQRAPGPVGFVEDSVRGSNSSEPGFAPGAPVRIRKWSADERIRTADPLFTNQAAIEFSAKFWLSMYS